MHSVKDMGAELEALCAMLERRGRQEQFRALLVGKGRRFCVVVGGRVVVVCGVEGAGGVVDVLGDVAYCCALIAVMPRHRHLEE